VGARRVAAKYGNRLIVLNTLLRMEKCGALLEHPGVR